MIPFRVNCTTALLFSAFLACAPASSSTRGGETASATARNTVAGTPAAASPQSQQPSPAEKDPEVTRADLARIAGSPSAKLWVIEVSDFQCPYCKQWHDETYPAFRDEYVRSGKVRFAYINYPLNSHQNAWPAAQTAMCASAQDKFWPMHEALFSTQHQWEVMRPPTSFFDSLARSIGLDSKKFTACVSSGRMKGLIQADHDRALAAGVSSTPTFLIGEKVIVGAIPIADMRKAVDSALAKSVKSAP